MLVCNSTIVFFHIHCDFLLVAVANGARLTDFSGGGSSSVIRIVAFNLRLK